MTAPRSSSTPVGYAWLQDQLGVPSFLAGREGRVANVNAMERLPEGMLLVPPRIAPAARILDQILFALKHEDLNLHLLSLALPRVSAAELEAEFKATPNGVYVRLACYLWERLADGLLDKGGATITAPYWQVFDPQAYAAGSPRRNQKWRIDFNGLGDIEYCPIVRLTAEIKALLAKDLLGQVRDFAERTSQAMLDRALAWAYLSETEGSFAIEGEVPTHSKASAFASLLIHAHDPRTLSEDYLCTLQNAAITNPLDKAVAFRHEQNRLQRGGRGAAGVTYVPPGPKLAAELMQHLMHLANRPPAQLDSLILAAVTSFGFVFIHPFMDGNGRLSRFLVHHCLGQSGKLPKAFVLPVSMAMKRNEDAYLAALTSFSRPARGLCQVTWIGGDDYRYDWMPSSDLAFRFIDMTVCVAFTLRMAEAALDDDLRREAQWLTDFDRVHKAIDDAFDIRSQDLSTLITIAFEHGGQLSKNRRKQYADRVPAATMDAIEREVQACVAARTSVSDSPVTRQMVWPEPGKSRGEVGSGGKANESKT